MSGGIRLAGKAFDGKKTILHAINVPVCPMLTVFGWKIKGENGTEKASMPRTHERAGCNGAFFA